MKDFTSSQGMLISSQVQGRCKGVSSRTEVAGVEGEGGGVVGGAVLQMAGWTGCQ